MKTVGTYELKTNLSEILDEVAAGETVRVTRRGVPIARVVPEQQMSPKEAIAKLRELRKGVRLDGLTVKELRDEGRR